MKSLLKYILGIASAAILVFGASTASASFLTPGSTGGSSLAPGIWNLANNAAAILTNSAWTLGSAAQPIGTAYITNCVGCAGGSGGVSTSTANTWTAPQTFNGGLTWTNATGTNTTGTNMYVSSIFQDAGRVAFGASSTFGIADSYDKFFDFAQTITDFSSGPNWDGLRELFVLNPTTNIASTQFYGHDTIVKTQSGNNKNIGVMNALYFTAEHQGSGTLGTNGGIVGVAQNSGSGIVTSQFGLISEAFNTGFGTTTANGAIAGQSGASAGNITRDSTFYIQSPLHAGTMASHTGMYIEDQRYGTVNNAIYSEGGDIIFQNAGMTLGGILNVATGTAALPSMTFAGHLTSGLSIDGADSVSISSGGISKISVGSSSILTASTLSPNSANAFDLGGNGVSLFPWRNIYSSSTIFGTSITAANVTSTSWLGFATASGTTVNASSGTINTLTSNAFSSSGATLTGGTISGITLSSSNATLTGGTLNGMSIGATTPSTGVFTNSTSTNSTSTKAFATNLSFTNGTSTSWFGFATALGTSLTSQTLLATSLGDNANGAIKWGDSVLGGGLNSGSFGAINFAEFSVSSTGIVIFAPGLVVPDTDGTTNLGMNGNSWLDVYSTGTIYGNAAQLNTLTIAGSSVKPNLSGSTISFGNALLSSTACTSTDTGVTGAASGMGVNVTPRTFPGAGVWFYGMIPSSNVVRTYICGDSILTPVASIYDIRVSQ